MADQQQLQQQQKPPKQSNDKVGTSWKTIIDGVMKKRKSDNNNSLKMDEMDHQEEDLVGKELAILLTKEFRYNNFNQDGVDDSNPVGPLLSSKNVKLVTNWIANMVRKEEISQPHRPKVETHKKPFWNPTRIQKMQRSLQVFCICFLLGICTFTVQLCTAAWWSARCVQATLLVFIRLLVDVNEIKAFMPSKLSRIISSDGPILQYLLWMDDIVLGGHIYQGREWAKDEFIFDRRPTAELQMRQNLQQVMTTSTPTYAPIHTSVNTYLTKLPPPTVKLHGKQLCTNPEFVHRKEWSKQTTEHVCAIDFCYVMLQEAAVRKQASRARRKVLDRNEIPLTPVRVKLLTETVGTTTPPTAAGNLATPDRAVIRDRAQTPTSSGRQLDRSVSDSILFHDLATANQAYDTPPRVNINKAPAPIDTAAKSTRSIIQDDAIEIVRDRDPHFFSDNFKARLRNRIDRAEGGPAIPQDYNESGGTLPEDAGYTRIEQMLTVDEDDDYDDRLDILSDCGSVDLASPTNRSLVSTNSDYNADLKWMDVGAEIGMKILGSAHVQRTLASQETAERILNIKETVETQLAARKNKKRSNSDVELPLDGRKSFTKGTSAPDYIEVGSTVSESAAAIKTPTKQQFTTEVPKPVPKPVHAMWTSAAAAAKNSGTPDVDQEKRVSLHVHVQDPDPIPKLESRKSDDAPSAPARRRWQKVAKKFKAPSNIFSLRRREDDETEVDLDDEDDVIFNRSNPSNLDLAVNVSHEEASTVRLRAESIEVVCYKEPDAGITPNSPPRSLLLPGVKVAVPLFPIQPGSRSNRKILISQFQMATVVISKRIYIGHGAKSQSMIKKRRTNCMSVTVKLDKSFLRGGEFAELTYRVMDDWNDQFVPKHSKLPIGSCVSTMFGLGVLVGWRVEDDVHVVRSLWQRRGPGSALAYLQRSAITSTIEASVGFEVDTALGKGEVLAYVDGGPAFRSGRFFVKIKEDGRHKDHVLELNRYDVKGCDSAQFMPVIELIREAAQYQLQLDTYNTTMRECAAMAEGEGPGKATPAWDNISKYANMLWRSFLKAIDEDDEFDEGMNHFLSTMINFLDNLDKRRTDEDESEHEVQGDSNDVVITASGSTTGSGKQDKKTKDENGFGIMNDFFGSVFATHKEEDGSGTSFGDQIGESESIEVERSNAPIKPKVSSYDRTFVVIRALMRTVSIARASCSTDDPEFKIAMSTCYELLLFARTVVKVQQKNTSEKSLKIWRRAWDEVVTTFGPLKDRLEKIAFGIRERAEKQGRRAKVRILRFVDIVVQDDLLLLAIEQGDWYRCAEQIESALILSKIGDEDSLEHLKRTAQFLIKHFSSASARNGSAAARNNEKLMHIASFIQSMASPRRSILKLFLDNNVFDVLERILVRVFRKEKGASRMLSMHASNFHTLRHLRMLKDLSVSGRLWIPILDAADDEFSWAASRMPSNAKDFMSPLSSLFSLCVVQFHKINAGDLTKNWLDFLLEDEAVKIIHDLDTKLILSLESFSKDVQEMMTVLPYYSSIEDDILNLMDEVDLDLFLREASEAVEDPDKLNQFIREKTTIGIERFLAYLPKMSIPVDKRDLGEGWVISCRGADGGDLTLSDVTIRRENLTCQIMGGDTIFFPMLSDDDDAQSFSTATTAGSMPQASAADHGTREGIDSQVKAVSNIFESMTSGMKTMRPKTKKVELSVLDHIRDLLLQAQKFGCWETGAGGVGQQPSDRYIASVLKGLPISSVLNCALELWRNLEIDDDELLEIAIRDVSYQIKLQQEREETLGKLPKSTSSDSAKMRRSHSIPSKMQQSQLDTRQLLQLQHRQLQERQYGSNIVRNDSPPDGTSRKRFNPRADPTVCFLEMKRLSLRLEQFKFCIQKHESKRTIFDPVFQGCGSFLVQNVSLKVRIECVKERLQKFGSEVLVPALQLRELDVDLEKVMLKVKDTGADWLLNKVVENFGDNLTEIVATNLKQQIKEQLTVALENINSYFEVNPELMLSVLGISMDDLDEKVVWV